MLRSLHHNGEEWKGRFLGEGALLLEPESGKESLHLIHQLCRTIESKNFPEVIDIVPAYASLAIHFDHTLTSHIELMDELEKLDEGDKVYGYEVASHEVPVCYEVGLDWPDITEHTGLNKKEIIERHSGKEYTVAMLGFLPGFIFLEGLDSGLSCPRRKTPRKQIPSGSVGIGGVQTGIYSLESPGGWNIMGQTPVSFFDSKNDPPIQIKAGDKVRFIPITEKKFRELKNG